MIKYPPHKKTTETEFGKFFNKFLLDLEEIKKEQQELIKNIEIRKIKQIREI